MEHNTPEHFNPAPSQGDQMEFNILEYVYLVRKHMWVIGLAGILGAIIGIALFISKPKVYRATAVLKLDPLHQDSLKFGESGQWAFGNYYFRTEFLNTEFETMKSVRVTDRVIDALTLDFFDQEFPKPKSSKSLLSRMISSVFGKEEVVEELTPEQIEEKRRSAARGLLKRSVEITERRETHLVNVSFRSPSPSVSKKVADAWVHAYKNDDLEQEYNRNQEAMSFVQASVFTLNKEIADLLTQKVALEKEYDIVTIGKNSSVEDEAVSKLNQSLIQAENDLIRARSLKGKMQETTANDSMEVSQKPSVQRLVAELATKQSQYNRDIKIYQEGLPRMQALRQEMTSLQGQLDQTRAQVYKDLLSDLTADVNAKNNTLERLRARLEEEKVSSVESRGELDNQINAIQSQINVKTKLLESLKLQEEDFNLALQLRKTGRSDKEIMQEAVAPRSPYAPSLKKHFAVGAVFGFLLAIGFVFLQEITDRKIHSVEMLEKVTGLPNLAMIPTIRDKLLGKAGRDFKADTLKRSMKIATELQQTMGNEELASIITVCKQSLEGQEKADSKAALEIAIKDLGKVQALAIRMIKAGVKNEQLSEMYQSAGYAMVLATGSEDQPEGEASKKKPKKAEKSRHHGLSQEEVAYGDTEDDVKYGVRMVVGCFTHIKPASPFSEAYRHLRTNIQLSDTRHKQILLLTSSVPGEGKTISSINLAVALSQLNKRVLLVDGDLRRSKLHKVFRLKNDLGMVNHLVGQTDSIKECYQKTFIPHLFLLSAGPHPPNPAELLASEKMEHLIAELREQFDYVIFDSSPVLAVTDSCIIGNMADATLFVSKASKTNREEAGRALQILRANKIHPLGTLFNDLDAGGKRGYGYGRYGYGGYGYGYGYGYSYKPEKA